MPVWPALPAHQPSPHPPLPRLLPLPQVCRRRYKEETAKLSQQLKSASQGYKATDKQSDRLQKEIDKLRWGAGWVGGCCRQAQLFVHYCGPVALPCRFLIPHKMSVPLPLPLCPHCPCNPCRQKATEGEAKLRAAVQDKTNAQLEKAGVERELKGLKAQAEKLTKNMDKVGWWGWVVLWVVLGALWGVSSKGCVHRRRS